MYILFLSLLFTTNEGYSLLSNNTMLNDEPMWINPCGYFTSNENFDDTANGMMTRILNLAKHSQYHIDVFKSIYINKIFFCDYKTHYQRWSNVNNVWMTPRLLKYADNDLTPSWLSDRSFPNELVFTFNILQRVSVGYEMLLEDASKFSRPENVFRRNFLTCLTDLKQLLCEVMDDIDITNQIKPVSIKRDAVPVEVRRETATAKRSLLNSIIFRDYMIAIKYILNTYSYLLHGHSVENYDEKIK